MKSDIIHVDFQNKMRMSAMPGDDVDLAQKQLYTLADNLYHTNPSVDLLEVRKTQATRYMKFMKYYAIGGTFHQCVTLQAGDEITPNLPRGVSGKTLTFGTTVCAEVLNAVPANGQIWVRDLVRALCKITRYNLVIQYPTYDPNIHELIRIVCEGCGKFPHHDVITLANQSSAFVWHVSKI